MLQAMRWDLFLRSFDREIIQELLSSRPIICWCIETNFDGEPLGFALRNILE